jgi:hypothetical protein
MPPGIFKKSADIFKEESNSQGTRDNSLYKIASAAGIDV